MQNSNYIYNLEFKGRPKLYRVYEVDIPLPLIPPPERIVNYGKDVEDQIFRRREVPKDINSWPKEKIEEYVKNEWHIRLNGYWIYIKGEPFYIPGCADFFFNYWHTEMGKLPQFRIKQLEWFLFWWYCERDPDCYGFIDIKARRGGDTEMSLCALYERTTRYKNMQGGMIHINQEGVNKNFRRLVFAHLKMPFFFRPLHVGAEKPAEGPLIFDIPGTMMTQKAVRENRIDTRIGLNSKILTSPAFTGAFDTDRLGTYYADEIFKVSSHRLDLLKQWGIAKRSLHLRGGDLIVGKAIMTSTVEQVDENNEMTTVDIARLIWEDSNPNNKVDGRTISGIYRIFRGVYDSAPVDKWGFPKVHKIKKRRDALIEKYRKEKRYDLILEIYRKEPTNIEEALVSSLGSGVLLPEKCYERISQLERKINLHGDKISREGVFGDLIWENGVRGGKVVWIPNDNGKWYITQHPVHPNKKYGTYNFPLPGNTDLYRCGVDPYDSTEIASRGSDGGIVVKMLFNLNIEKHYGNDVIVDDSGMIVNEEVIPYLYTNQPVCDYRYRHENPYDFYDDVLKTIFYYGCQCFPETTKDGFRTWMINNGYDNWLQVQPKALVGRWSKKNQKGMAGTDRSISLYVDFLKMYISSYIWCVYHPRIIKEWAEYNDKMRTKLDLAVASGYAELASLDAVNVVKKEKDHKYDVFEYYDEVYV